MASQAGGRNAYFCPKCEKQADPGDAACRACGLHRPEKGWPRDPWIGSVVADKYLVIERIGRGGMGSVYLAEQTWQGSSLGRVAIKFLQPMGTAMEQEILRNKFVSEAGFSRLFDSPHIIKVYDFGIWQGETYMAMEFLKGETLDDRLYRVETLRQPVAVDIARQIAEALVEVHRHEVVHRDIKPENILLLEVEGKDFVKILDFGIAKRLDPRDGGSSTRIGTPAYMPPEQCEGGAVDVRADLYSLGILMWECLVGETPPSFGGLQVSEDGGSLGMQPRDIGKARPGLAEDLVRLVNSMVDPNPCRRPRSAASVVETLKKLQSDLPDLGARPSPTASRADELLAETYATTPGRPQGAGRQAQRRPRPGNFPRRERPSASRTASTISPAFRKVGILAGLLSVLAVGDWLYIHYARGGGSIRDTFLPHSGGIAAPAADASSDETGDAAVDTTADVWYPEAVDTAGPASKVGHVPKRPRSRSEKK